MKPGDTAYIIENGNRVLEVQIFSVSGGMYTCKLPSGGAIRLKPGRLYPTEEEAINCIYQNRAKHRTPYDYM